MAIHITTSPNQLQFPVHSDLYYLKSLILVVWQHLNDFKTFFFILLLCFRYDWFYVLKHLFIIHTFLSIFCTHLTRLRKVYHNSLFYRIKNHILFIVIFIHLWNFNNLSAISITIYFSVSIAIANNLWIWFKLYCIQSKMSKILLPSNLNASETKPK